MIPLAVPNLEGNEKKYLIDCIDTTFVSSVGEYVNRFEKMVADAVGSANAVTTSSGTAGLYAALHAARAGHGDLVIVPTFTFIASANAVRHCGADPWLMDVSECDWCLDPDLARSEKEEGIEARTFWKPVHLQKPYRNCLRSDVGISERLWQRIVTLPCSTNITRDELEYVARSVRLLPFITC